VRALFVVEQGARVVRRGERIVVLLGDVTMEQMRTDELAQCVVMGNVSLTPPAVKAMLRHGVDVVFMTRSGGFIGRLTCGLSRNVMLRRCQFRALEDPAIALQLAAACVRGKIENQRRLLARYQKRRSSDDIARALVGLRHSLSNVSGATDPDVLRGVEGRAAALYFGCWKTLITAEGIRFHRRLRRPPPDPVNILLSFGYTQLANAIHAMVESAGLDPYLGALHAPKYGRPSLVLDLLEEFRPVVVDTAVLRALNVGSIRLRDFEFIAGDDNCAEERLLQGEYNEEGEPRDEGAEALRKRPPVIFLKSGIRKWVTEYHRRMNEKLFYAPRNMQLSLEQIVLAQVRHLSTCLESGDRYAPFIAPR
jgi:CRISP-associated protein Cas1